MILSIFLILLSHSHMRWAHEQDSTRGEKHGTSCAKPPDCVSQSRYRNLDGSCNNVKNPALGMAGMPYGRMCDDNYSDRGSGMPKAKSGNELPNVRTLSYELSPEKIEDNKVCTLITQQFGQMIAHDYSLTSGVGQIGKKRISCCDKDKSVLTKIMADSRCAPILIPKEDPIYTTNSTLCLHVARTHTTTDKKCRSPYDSAMPISDVTPWLDCSEIYGNSVEDNKKIREYKGGRLKYVVRNGQKWPPQQTEGPGLCTEQNADEPCYLAGDFRVTQSPQLALLQIVAFREHNRCCDEMAVINPCWDDEKLFQECRRILIAIFQHIVYDHYLHVIIGSHTAISEHLTYDDDGYVNDYDAKDDPAVAVEFASAAYRSFHTLVAGEIKMYTEDRQRNKTMFLRDCYLQPGILEKSDNYFHDIAVGLVTQPASGADQYYVTDITHDLLRGKGKQGSDLRALDIQRARDHGVCTYVVLRKACGLFVPKSFDDLSKCDISKENVAKLKNLYECVDDLEPAVMIPLEQPAPDAQIGATGLCVLVKQYRITRTSDRHFFQNGEPHVSFTTDQLKAIRTGTSISRLFCDNVLGVQSMQPNAFNLVSYENPLTPCNKLPGLDFELWKDNDCC